MQSKSIKEIRDELKNYPEEELRELCLRMAKFKKDNKELLSYLLFESENEEGYIQSVKEEIDLAFKTMNRKGAYQTKKSLRKILKDTNQSIRYSGNKRTEAELLIYYCRKMRGAKLPFSSSPVLRNMYARQVQLIEAAVGKLHEDLQYDFEEDIAWLKA